MNAQRLIITFCFAIANLITPSVHADGEELKIHHLEKTKILIAKEAFQEHLSSGRYSDFTLASKVEDLSGISVAEMILDLIEPLINEPESVQLRIKNLVEILQAELSRTQLSLADKEILRDRLGPFLKRYGISGSRSNELIVSIYSRNGLWTAEELGYLLGQVKSSAYVLKNFSAIANLGKQLDPDGRVELGDAIEKSRPYTLAPILLVYEFKELSLPQITQLLQSLFNEFRPAIEAGNSETFRPSHNMALRASAIKILEDLQIRFDHKDEVVVAAIKNRVSKASSAEARIFFRMFSEHRYQNLRYRYPNIDDMIHPDPLDIQSKILKEKSNALSPLHFVDSREGNVVGVNFQMRASCLQLFSLN